MKIHISMTEDALRELVCTLPANTAQQFVLFEEKLNVLK